MKPDPMLTAQVRADALVYLYTQCPWHQDLDPIVRKATTDYYLVALDNFAQEFPSSARMVAASYAARHFANGYQAAMIQQS